MTVSSYILIQTFIAESLFFDNERGRPGVLHRDDRGGSFVALKWGAISQMGRHIERFFPKSVALSALGLVLLGVFGCGSETETKTGVPGSAKLLKEEDMYKYEGEGKNKRKVLIDMNERRKLLREAGKKIETH
jgi:hypothetical protein